MQLVFWVPVAVVLLTVGLGEADILPVGVLAEDKEAEFVLASIMEVLTIVAIPLALKLFKLKPIAARLATTTGVSALLSLHVGGLRLSGHHPLAESLLCLPVVVKVL